jgi:DNA-binding NarL/FixJ family response regulator
MDQLTPRENEVIEHLKLGKPNKIIAFEMHLFARPVCKTVLRSRSSC